MHPVRKEIAQVCMEENLIDEVRQNKSTIVENIVEEIIKDLINKSIVQKVVINLTDGKTSATNGDTTAYVVHPLVRAYIFERLHKCVFVSLPSLQLPGFSSGKEIVDPGNDRGRKTAENLFLKLCEQAGKKSEEAGRLAKVERAAEETQEGAEKVNAKPEEKESEKNAKIACDMCPSRL